MRTSTSAINPFRSYVKLHCLNSTHLEERVRRKRERKKPGRLSERKTESTADAAPISWISSTAFSAIKLQVIWLRANERHTWNSVKVLAAELACFANSPDAQLNCDPNANRQTNLNLASCPEHIGFLCENRRCFGICLWYLMRMYSFRVSGGWFSPLSGMGSCAN